MITWPELVQITRYTSLNEPQFLGCLTAFVDSLLGSLNTAIMYLRKLEGGRKGAAFSFEMHLDQGRYGAMLILDRWADFLQAFRPHVAFPRFQTILDETPGRVRIASELLERTNRIIDSAGDYTEEMVAAATSGFQALQLTFTEEQKAAEQALALGPMLPPDFAEYRRVFLADLAAR